MSFDPASWRHLTIEAAAVLVGDSDHFAPGWFIVDDGYIAEAGLGRAPATAGLRIQDRLVAPGFVDVHCHGGGGADFSGGPVAARTVLAAHRHRGTTAMVASLVTAGWADLMAQADALAPLVAAGELAGVHLEGPWLAPAKRGAHNPDLLITPQPALVDDVIARREFIKMVTIAPELPGAMEAIRRLHKAGITAAVGHTMADYATAQAAIDAGARGATHLFNAMPPLGHREPGPVLALAQDPRVFCELIFDGHHVAPDLAATVFRLLPGRVPLITDAMAAAGLGDGVYDLGGLPVNVEAGVARLAADPAHNIAGSTIRLGDAVENAVLAGARLAGAVIAASRTPADYLGLKEVGRIAEGCRADFVELRPDGVVQRVYAAGVPQT